MIVNSDILKSNGFKRIRKVPIILSTWQYLFKGLVEAINACIKPKKNFNIDELTCPLIELLINGFIPNLIVVDETHHIEAASYRNIMNFYDMIYKQLFSQEIGGEGIFLKKLINKVANNEGNSSDDLDLKYLRSVYNNLSKDAPVHLLGLTATPERTSIGFDGKLSPSGLANTFSYMVCAPTGDELIKAGYLSSYTYYAIKFTDDKINDSISKTLKSIDDYKSTDDSESISDDPLLITHIRRDDVTENIEAIAKVALDKYDTLAKAKIEIDIQDDNIIKNLDQGSLDELNKSLATSLASRKFNFNKDELADHDTEIATLNGNSNTDDSSGVPLNEQRRRMDKGSSQENKYYITLDESDLVIKEKGENGEESEVFRDSGAGNYLLDVVKENNKLYKVYYGKAVVYCCYLADSETVANLINKRINISSTRLDDMTMNNVGTDFFAVPLSGSTSRNLRESILKEMNKGYHETSLRIVCNVDLIGEGVDIPSLNAVLLLRPTKSLRLYIQQSTRGLRVSKGKTNSVVIDAVGNYATFSNILPTEFDWKLIPLKNSTPQVKKEFVRCPICGHLRSFYFKDCIYCFLNVGNDKLSDISDNSEELLNDSGHDESKKSSSNDFNQGETYQMSIRLKKDDEAISSVKVLNATDYKLDKLYNDVLDNINVNTESHWTLRDLVLSLFKNNFFNLYYATYEFIALLKIFLSRLNKSSIEEIIKNLNPKESKKIIKNLNSKESIDIDIETFITTELKGYSDKQSVTYELLVKSFKELVTLCDDLGKNNPNKNIKNTLEDVFSKIIEDIKKYTIKNNTIKNLNSKAIFTDIYKEIIERRWPTDIDDSRFVIPIINLNPVVGDKKQVDLLRLIMIYGISRVAKIKALKNTEVSMSRFIDYLCDIKFLPTLQSIDKAFNSYSFVKDSVDMETSILNTFYTKHFIDALNSRKDNFEVVTEDLLYYLKWFEGSEEGNEFKQIIISKIERSKLNQKINSLPSIEENDSNEPFSVPECNYFEEYKDIYSSIRESIKQLYSDIHDCVSVSLSKNNTYVKLMSNDNDNNNDTDESLKNFTKNLLDHISIEFESELESLRSAGDKSIDRKKVIKIIEKVVNSFIIIPRTYPTQCEKIIEYAYTLEEYKEVIPELYKEGFDKIIKFLKSLNCDLYGIILDLDFVNLLQKHLKEIKLLVNKITNINDINTIKNSLEDLHKIVDFKHIITINCEETLDFMLKFLGLTGNYYDANEEAIKIIKRVRESTTDKNFCGILDKSIQFNEHEITLEDQKDIYNSIKQKYKSDPLLLDKHYNVVKNFIQSQNYNSLNSNLQEAFAKLQNTNSNFDPKFIDDEDQQTFISNIKILKQIIIKNESLYNYILNIVSQTYGLDIKEIKNTVNKVVNKTVNKAVKKDSKKISKTDIETFRKFIECAHGRFCYCDININKNSKKDLENLSTVLERLEEDVRSYNKLFDNINGREALSSTIGKIISSDNYIFAVYLSNIFNKDRFIMQSPSISKKVKRQLKYLLRILNESESYSTRVIDLLEQIQKLLVSYIKAKANNPQVLRSLLMCLNELKKETYIVFHDICDELPEDSKLDSYLSPQDEYCETYCYILYSIINLLIEYKKDSRIKEQITILSSNVNTYIKNYFPYSSLLSDSIEVINEIVKQIDKTKNQGLTDLKEHLGIIKGNISGLLEKTDYNNFNVGDFKKLVVDNCYKYWKELLEKLKTSKNMSGIIDIYNKLPELLLNYNNNSLKPNDKDFKAFKTKLEENAPNNNSISKITEKIERGQELDDNDKFELDKFYLEDIIEKSMTENMILVNYFAKLLLLLKRLYRLASRLENTVAPIFEFDDSELNDSNINNGEVGDMNNLLVYDTVAKYLCSKSVESDSNPMYSKEAFEGNMKKYEGAFNIYRTYKGILDRMRKNSPTEGSSYSSLLDLQNNDDNKGTDKPTRKGKGTRKGSSTNESLFTFKPKHMFLKIRRKNHH